MQVDVTPMHKQVFSYYTDPQHVAIGALVPRTTSIAEGVWELPDLEIDLLVKIYHVPSVHVAYCSR